MSSQASPPELNTSDRLWGDLVDLLQVRDEVTVSDFTCPPETRSVVEELFNELVRGGIVERTDTGYTLTASGEEFLLEITRHPER